MSACRCAVCACGCAEGLPHLLPLFRKPGEIGKGQQLRRRRTGSWRGATCATRSRWYLPLPPDLKAAEVSSCIHFDTAAILRSIQHQAAPTGVLFTAVCEDEPWQISGLGLLSASIASAEDCMFSLPQAQQDRQQHLAPSRYLSTRTAGRPSTCAPSQRCVRYTAARTEVYPRLVQSELAHS